MNKPTVYPRFAFKDKNDSISGQINVREPEQSLKDFGFTRNQKPTNENKNWLYRITDDWIEWFDSLFGSEITESIVIFDQPLKTTDSPSFAGLTVNSQTISASGTPVSLWALDNDAGAYPQLKNDAGVLRIRNKDDNDDADLIVKNLTVNGTTTTVQSETLEIADNIILLNSNVTGTPTEDGGMEVERGTETNASLIWDEGSDVWKAGLTGSEIQLADINYQGVWDINGTVNYYNGGNVGIGISSPDGTLHVHTASAGTVTADTGADGLVVENNSVGGITILTPDISSGQLCFGSPSDNNAGRIVYSPSGTGDPNTMRFYTAGSEQMRIDNSGNVGIGTSSPSRMLDVNSDIIRLRTSKTPSSAGDTGNTGDICWDSSYVYVCTATNTWKRAAISTW